jgi:2-dehydropantoate 2-reductase
MEICIYGVGGVGGYFGGKIAQILKNHPEFNHKLYFIAGGSHLKCIQKNGLLLKLDGNKSCVCVPDLATDNVDYIPNIDLLFVCVKSYDLDDAIKAVLSKIHSSTIIIPLLNGITIYERIRKITSRGIILPACVYVGTHIESPGVIVQKGGEGKIMIGPDNENPDISYDQVLTLLNMLEIKFEWHNNPEIPIWTKYLFIASYGLVCAGTEKTIGQVYEDNQLKNDVSSIMKEILLIANKENIELPEDILNSSLKKAQQFPFETKTSFQRDIEIKGKRNENDIFGQAIIELGKKHGVSTTITKKYNSMILNRLNSSFPK